MKGDRLASGEKSAQFSMTPSSGKLAENETIIEGPKDPRRFPCECGKAFPTAREFSDHVHEKHVL